VPPAPAPVATDSPKPPAAAPPTAPEAESPATEPEPSGELVAEDLAVLGILSQEGRLPEARTAGTLAISLEKTPAEVEGILAKLAAADLATSDVGPVGGAVWSATLAGLRRLEEDE
jgi:hypothetical protein